MLLQRLFATVWYVNVFGDMVMKSLYSSDETLELINKLKKRGVSFRIEYEEM